jgi:pyruvate dehydrogenase E1 component alpha subunit
MHLFDKAHDFMGGYGIVGGQVPLGVGVAWAQKQLRTGKVCVCFMGEGAASQGAFFEALCLAQLYRLPIVIIVENNYYAMGTAVDRQSAVVDMSRRGLGVGMAAEQFEAFDVRTVRDRVGAAVAHARSGEGPVLLEALTYRFRGHSMSDPAKYRKEGELDERKKSDPLALAEHALEELGVPASTLEEARASAEAEAEDAWRFAESSPAPDAARLYDYTYAPGAP